MNNVVAAALVLSAQTSPEYLARCLATRRHDHPDRAGSFYITMREEEILIALLGAMWEPYSHPAIAAPAVAFVAPIPGWNGMVEVDNLPAGVEVTMIDPKDTGRVSASAVSPRGWKPFREEFTVIILGPVAKDDDRLIVWTFHPGPPIPPPFIPRVTPEGVDLHGRTMTVEAAKAAGVKWVKVTA